MSKNGSASKATLDGLGFPNVVLEMWRTEGIKQLLPLQIKALGNDRLFTKNSLVVGPTSCGKTFVGELVCIHHALRRRRCLFLVPFKALAEEKYREFLRKYGRTEVGVGIIISTSDRRDQDRMLVEGDFDIAILTNEKLSAMIVTHPGLLANVGALIIDEIQMLRDESRGAELELLLTRARQIAPGIQVVGLSAVVSDLKGFDEWLDAQLIDDDRRPVPLREGVIGPNGSFTYVEWGGLGRTKGSEVFPKLTGNSEEELAVSLTTHLLQHPREQVIVFAPTVAGTQALAKQISNQVTALPPAKELLERMADSEQTDSIVALSETLAHSVAFHNADLTLDERLAVEEGFRGQQVRCIVSTSTLSMGVNLPASAIVIVEASKWTRSAGRWNKVPLTVGEYRNMSGRAGRFGFNTDAFGRSFLICKSPFHQSSAAKAYVEAVPEPLTSVLLTRPIPDLLLKTLTSGLCESVDGFSRFLLKTYAAHEAIREGRGISDLRESIEDAARDLIDASLVETNKKGRLTATALGIACASSGISAESFAEIVTTTSMSTASVTDVAYIASILSDSGPDAAGIRLSGMEQHGRGPVFIRLIRDVELQTRGLITAAMLESLPDGSIPNYETVRALKFQAVALAYVNGVASQEIENRLGASAGRARGIGALCSWISDTASKIAWIRHNSDEARKYELISERFLHGCSEAALLLASVPHNLHRAEREALVAAGYNSLQSIVDASATEIASAAHINKQRVDRLQKGIVELIGDSLTLERQQLARLRTAGEPTIVIESLYALKGTPLEQAIENLLVAPFCPLKVARIANQREGEADLRIILSDGSAGIAQVTAKDNPTDKIGIVKATAVLSQSPNLKPRVFICIGRPDFLPDAIKKASDHVANKMNFKLIPICVLAEMYVRFRENRISAERVQNILESETGYIDFSFL